MKAKPLPSQELLNRLLEYNPDTGSLFWKLRTPDLFSDGTQLLAAQKCYAWNIRFAFEQAFISVDDAGYLRGKINGVSYLAQRVIWKMVYGQDPEIVDHRNRVKNDNRLTNLRNTDKLTNSRNAKLARNNSTGVNGVYLLPSGKYAASLGVNGKSTHLGCFATIEQAAMARKEAEIKLGGFTEGHGTTVK
jgi:hypothetical protein